MNKRYFLKTLLGLAAGLPAAGRAATTARPRPVHLQTSPLAGFQYHAGDAVWPQLNTPAPACKSGTHWRK